MSVRTLSKTAHTRLMWGAELLLDASERYSPTTAPDRRRDTFACALP